MADRDLWVGTDDGLIWRTRDEGEHWTNVTPKALQPWSKVGILEASHFDAETAYAAVDRHRLDDFKPYVYRTRDGGAHWQLAVAGIPGGSFVNAVREDPVKKGLLYAGTEKGVYFSLDDGDHWQPLQANLPVTSVRDLEVHGDDLVIATHGRAFWVLDDVAPLRQLDARVEGAAAWLFEPATAVRFLPAGFTGTPSPKDEAAAPNPPSGALLDYALKTAARQVALEIRDGQGGLVRRYTSADPAPEPGSDEAQHRPRLGAAPGAALDHPRDAPFRLAPQGTPRRPALGAAPARATTTGRRAPRASGRRPAATRWCSTSTAARLTQPLVVAPTRGCRSRPGLLRQFRLARRIEEARVQVATASREVGALPPRSPSGGRRRSRRPSRRSTPWRSGPPS